MKTYKISYQGKSTLVTAKDRIKAKQIGINLYFKDLPELLEADKITQSLLSFIEAKEVPKLEKQYPWYVTFYRKYPIYEPAEGGYYYSGVGMTSSHGFDTFKKAKRFLRKKYEECMLYESHKSKYWVCNESHTFFGQPSQKYIGDGWYIKLERRQGEDIRGWEPYC